MEKILIFIVGVALGIWIGKLRRADGKDDTASEISAGKAAPLHKATAGKEDRKERIMRLFSEKSEIQNDDVEKLLGVSDATATNYLSELEAEGKVEQVGERGRGVFYTIKNG
ncbi:MAG: FaeA/PapI family transcriptional regulator [bacterium]|nr:FaeA/PapI family transcriptional regulator [bacterium]